MDWSGSSVLCLARLSCTCCGGTGMRWESLEEGSTPCQCVLRAVFRACYARFRVCVARDKPLSKIRFEPHGGRHGRMVWGRKDEEYAADFCLIGRRTLDPYLYRLFSYHYLLGGDWRLCCRRMRLDRGDFFHHLYRVQEALGRVFCELKPYGLFPPREYFATHVGGCSPPSPPSLRGGTGPSLSPDLHPYFRDRLLRRRRPRPLSPPLAGGATRACLAAPAA